MSSVGSVEVVPAAVSQGGGQELPLLGSDEGTMRLMLGMTSCAVTYSYCIIMIDNAFLLFCYSRVIRIVIPVGIT